MTPNTVQVDPSLQNETAYRRLLEIISTRSYGCLDEVFRPDAVLHTFADPRPTSIAEANAPMWEAFPDMAITIERLVATDTHVAADLTWSGTHAGPLFGMPATGRSVRMAEIEICRFIEGRICELWNVPDLPGVLAQLGQ